MERIKADGVLTLTSGNWNSLAVSSQENGRLEKYQLTSQNNSIYNLITEKTTFFDKDKITSVTIEWNSSYSQESIGWFRETEEDDALECATRIDIHYIKSEEERYENFLIWNAGTSKKGNCAVNEDNCINAQGADGDVLEQAKSYGGLNTELFLDRPADGYSIFEILPMIADIAWNSKGTITCKKNEQEKWDTAYSSDMELNSFSPNSKGARAKMEAQGIEGLELYWVTTKLTKAKNGYFRPVTGTETGIPVTVASIYYTRDGIYHYENFLSWEEDEEFHRKGNAQISDDGSLNYQGYDEEVQEYASTYGGEDGIGYLEMPEDEFSIYSVFPNLCELEWAGEGTFRQAKEKTSYELAKKDVHALIIYQDEKNIETKITSFIRENHLPNGLTLTPTSVTIEEFGKNPDSFLKDEKGEYQYDVVVVGPADSNVGKDISGKARCALKEYVKAGYGFLAGHGTLEKTSNVTSPVSSKSGVYADDSETTITDGTHWNMMDVVSAGSNMIYNYNSYVGSKETSSELVDNLLKIEKEGQVVSYPFDFGNKTPISIDGSQWKTMDAYPSHTSGEFTYGDVWVSYTSNVGALFEPKTTCEGKTGTENFYLTTCGNVGVSQMGHTKGQFSDDEMKLYINTIFYLAQTQLCEVCNDGKTVARVARDANHLKELVKDNPAGCYVLDSDMELPADWTPVTKFQGHFLTNGHEVTFADGLSVENRRVFRIANRAAVAVTDKEGHPLRNVPVELKGAVNYSLETDNNGICQQDGIQSGDYHVLVCNTNIRKIIHVDESDMNTPILLKHEEEDSVKLSFYAYEGKQKLVTEFYTLPECKVEFPDCPEGKADYDFLYWSDGRKTYKKLTRYEAGEVDKVYMGVWKYTGLSSVTDLTDGDVTATSAKIYWGESPEAEQVVGYLVYRDGVKIATVSTTMYEDVTLLPETDYVYHIIAVNVDGKTSKKGNELMITTKPDTEAPTAPSSLSVYDLTGSRITLKIGAARDNVAVTAYEIYRDGILAATVSGEDVWDDTEVEEGKTYTYTARAWDAAGNQSDESQVMKARVSKPVIEAVSPKESEWLGGARVKLGIILKKLGIAEKLQVTAEYKKDEDWVLIGTIPTVRSAAFDFDTEALTDGNYQVKAVAKDWKGNESEKTTQFEVDNTGISKIVIREVKRFASYVALKWEQPEEDDFGHFEVEQLINGEYKKVSQTKTTLGVNIENLKPDQVYTFRVVGFDALGNRGIPSDEVVVEETRDMDAPFITMFGPGSSRYNKQLGFEVTAQDDVVSDKLVLSYSFDKKEWNPLTTIQAAKEEQSYKFKYTWNVEELPEGEVHVKAEAYDKEENCSSVYGETLCTYIIDRTPPDATSSLVSKTLGGVVRLEWNKGPEEDLCAYNVYRCEAESEKYEKIANGTNSLSYVDRNVTFGKTYRYCITGIDAAGNESEYSNVVMIQVGYDKTIPKFLGLSPANEKTFCKNGEIKLVCADDRMLQSVILQYRKAEDDSAVWQTLKTFSLNEASAQLNVTWKNEDLECGKYEFMATAKDASGNVSEPYRFTYRLDNIGPAAPVVRIVEDNWKLTLNWDMYRDEKCKGFQIYKKKADGEFALIKNLTSRQYIDEDVNPDFMYSYQVYAVDDAGNRIASAVVTGLPGNQDVIRPVAAASQNLSGVTGKEIVFDGTQSTDNVRVVKYVWTMGNGDIRTGGKISYAYDTPGNYTVTLTVSDAMGNEDKVTSNVTVLESTLAGTARIQVSDMLSNPVAYSSIYIKLSEKEHLCYDTDQNGRIELALESGTYKVAAYKPGYLPMESEITVHALEDMNKTIRLEKSELVTGNLNVKKLTYDEMIEKGVNLKAPENYHTYMIQFTFTFQQHPTPLTEEIMYSGMDISDFNFGFGGGGSGGGGGGDGQEGGGHQPTEGMKTFYQKVSLKKIDEEEPVFAYLRRTESISWLKDIYEVTLGVMNNAAPQFSIVDAKAKLNIPDGLSLAKMQHAVSVEQSMGTIKGQESKSVSWCLKGDQIGDYTLSADFQGVLMPFERVVKVTFKTEKSFHVSAGEGLHLYVYPEKTAYLNENYFVQYRLVNEAEHSFYNVSTSFTNSAVPYKEERKYYYKNGRYNHKETNLYEPQRGTVYEFPAFHEEIISPMVQSNDSIRVKELKPGQCLVGTYYANFSNFVPTEQYQGRRPEEVYYELVDAAVNELQGANLGIKVDVIPVDGHLSIERINECSFDPIDLTTGAFTENHTLRILSQKMV